MRSVVRQIGERELDLRLTLDGLDSIAEVNPQFGEIAMAFAVGVWRWDEVKAIVSAALRPHGVRLADAVDDLGVEGCKELAAEIWREAMPKASLGNGLAGVASGGQPASTSPASSETA